MTKVYITIDTEYSAGIYNQLGREGRVENYHRSILGKTPQGDVGIGYQMDVFDRYGLKAVFFVDPMPALIWGIDAISDIIKPIIRRGHDVQLHLHSEWLALAGDANPLGNQTGQNIKDFSLEEQKRLLGYAAETLVAAGAHYPVAFRAGNYGANDDTLRALAELGINYDSSYCPGIAVAECDITLPKTQHTPTKYCSVNEIPIGAIAGFGDKMRHAQITALSAKEMIAAIRFAYINDWDSFTIVSHSFELMSRDRSRTNRIVKRRFEKICTTIAKLPGVQTATYVDHPPALNPQDLSRPLLPHNMARTALRLGEQAFGNALYGS